ncbi:MAG: 50S ribosomal protein L5 [Bacilli bacterium]|nr:50S ribosomal protein L5 [Bacilli bacterium]
MAENKKVETPKAEKKVAAKVKDNYVPRLKVKYFKEVVPHLVEKFKYTSKMAAPRLEKIVVNIGLGDATVDSKVIDASVKELGLITGQHPVTTKAKKSIATFKLRQGQAIGCKVTLRGTRMYEFFDKLVSIALPRVRDFRGVSTKAFDGHGNYTLGVKEQLIFPEIDYDKVSKVRGMDIVIVTTARTDNEARALLDEMGMPFHR